jgi:hypothetical protein
MDREFYALYFHNPFNVSGAVVYEKIALKQQQVIFCDTFWKTMFSKTKSGPSGIEFNSKLESKSIRLCRTRKE